jgi:hypothetical protein
MYKMIVILQVNLAMMSTVSSDETDMSALRDVIAAAMAI